MKTAAFLVAATSIGLAAIAAPTPAKADRCVVVPPPSYGGYAPVYYSYHYEPYMWSGYITNYSNFSPIDCGYYNRRFYSAVVVYPRRRYVIHRVYR